LTPPRFLFEEAIAVPPPQGGPKTSILFFLYTQCFGNWRSFFPSPFLRKKFFPMGPPPRCPSFHFFFFFGPRKRSCTRFEFVFFSAKSRNNSLPCESFSPFFFLPFSFTTALTMGSLFFFFRDFFAVFGAGFPPPSGDERFVPTSPFLSLLRKRPRFTLCAFFFFFLPLTPIRLSGPSPEYKGGDFHWQFSGSLPSLYSLAPPLPGRGS